jgi:glycerol uptake facilitator protein
MRSPFFGEFMGTMMLILLGDGVVAGVLLKRSKSEKAGWMVVTSAWAFAVLAGILTANVCGSSDAHLNPAITVAVAFQSGNFSKVVPYFIAQVLGAFTGATLVWLHFLPHWSETEDAESKRGVFCTIPAIRSYPANLLSEVIATAVLVVVAGAIGSKLVFATGPAAGVGPYLVGCLVWGIGLSLGGTTGYAINPARDFGPRLAHFVLPIAGKAGSDWAYAWIPIAGPILGGIGAGLFLRFLGA